MTKECPCNSVQLLATTGFSKLLRHWKLGFSVWPDTAMKILIHACENIFVYACLFGI